MKKIIVLVVLFFGFIMPSMAMQAVMFGIESAQTNGSNVDIRVVVCFSDPSFNGGVAAVESTLIANVDPSATVNQIQSAIAAGIRAAAAAKGFTIPANGVTLMGMSKG